MPEFQIAANDRRAGPFVASAGQTVFPYDFPLFDAADIAVYAQATGAASATLLPSSAYSVTGVGVEVGGTIVLATGATAGTIYSILGARNPRRTTDFSEAGELRAATLNQELDLLAQTAQEQAAGLGRALRLAETDTASSTVLPVAAARANKLLAFDGAGAPTLSSQTLATIEGGSTAASASATAAAASAASAAAVLLQNFTGTSTSSVAIGTGGKSFTTQTGKGFVAGTLVRVTDQAAPTVNFMVGTVTGYVTGTGVLSVNVTEIGGGGTLAAWNIVVTGQTGAQGAAGSTGATGPAGSLGSGGSLGGSIEELAGPDIASAATTNIWLNDGNYRVVTGTTAITSFGTAPQAGAQRVLRFAGALTLTNGANLILPGAANIVTTAGDVAIVRADTTTQYRVVAYLRASGAPVALADQSVTARTESDDAWGSLASATTPDLGAQNVRNVLITGTTTIAGFGNTGGEGRPYRVRFAGALTLTHNATSLILPGGANIVTAAGDTAEFVKESGTGNWRCTDYQRANGQALVATSSGPTFATEQATTSGTAFDFTGISASAKRIQIVLNGVSLSGTDNLLVQIGDSGGIETTGYLSVSGDLTVNITNTSGYCVRAGGNAANLTNGILTLIPIAGAGGATWILSGAFGAPQGPQIGTASGSKTVSAAPLDRIRITRTGTDTFDAGSVNILVEV